MSADWADDYCDKDHVILGLECGECVEVLRAELAAVKQERDEARKWAHDSDQLADKCNALAGERMRKLEAAQRERDTLRAALEKAADDLFYIRERFEHREELKRQRVSPMNQAWERARDGAADARRALEEKP